jgi:hypothetical protein
VLLCDTSYAIKDVTLVAELAARWIAQPVDRAGIRELPPDNKGSRRIGAWHSRERHGLLST